MPWQILHFRDSEKIIADKGLAKTLTATLTHINKHLYDRRFFGGPLRRALEDKGWRQDLEELKFLDGRKYRFKGFKDGIAIESDLSSYEGILCGIFRLQVGFDKGLVEAGVLLINGQRGENSRLGTSFELAKKEVEELFPTINLPVSIVLFDLGTPPMVEDDDDTKEVEHAAVSDGAQA